jgi:hypothetical protein
MSGTDDHKALTRQKLKRLRGERDTQVKAAQEASTAVRAERKKIVAEMADTARTVPQLAAATDMSTDRVLWHVAAMRKDGELAEAPDKDGDYFTYALVPDEDKEKVDEAASDKAPTESETPAADTDANEEG